MFGGNGRIIMYRSIGERHAKVITNSLKSYLGYSLKHVQNDHFPDNSETANIQK